MNIIDLTPKELRKAANLQEKIQALQHQLGLVLDGSENPVPFFKDAGKRKRKFSASAKARMRKAQKARWAKVKGAKTGGKPRKKMSAKGLANIRVGVLKRMKNQGKATKKPKRKMSAAGKAALSAAATARWAKAKAAGKTTL
jgi:hypothetical protein